MARYVVVTGEEAWNPVPRPDFPKTLAEFQVRFTTEDACRRYLMESTGAVHPSLRFSRCSGSPVSMAPRPTMGCMMLSQPDR